MLNFLQTCVSNVLWLLIVRETFWIYDIQSGVAEIRMPFSHQFLLSKLFKDDKLRKTLSIFLSQEGQFLAFWSFVKKIKAEEKMMGPWLS